ncbi:MAG: class I SAM-dependent rRNA methyltransferase [Deltaproteobacteria bacterium]|nr:class I SAM-dependent rRNA methyltransferase [Deltaproteobacteria bacterium]
MNLSVEEKLQKAFEKRKCLHGDPDTNGYRLFHGLADGIEGFSADRYGHAVILMVREGQNKLDTADLEGVAGWYSQHLPVTSVYVKHFVKDRTASEPTTRLLLGVEAPSEIEIMENGTRFRIRPYSGFSTGLFLDQRENRKFIAGRCNRKTVLNCFAYTCAFSVFCASGGGIVSSVDLSNKYLQWGKENFQLNQLGLERHRFVAMDAFDFIGRSKRKGELYDLVIVDPPSFSRSKTGKVFSLTKDLDRLLLGALSIIKTGGELFFSCNYSRWDSAELIRRARKVLASLHLEQVPKLPVDFPSGEPGLSYFLVRKGKATV